MIDVEDFGAGLIRFGNGALLTLEASWLGFQPENETWKVQLFGTQAGALWPACRMFGETNGRPWNVQFDPPRGEKPHQALIRDFARALLNDEPVPIPPEQSANTIAMLEALYESSAQRREVAVEMFPLPTQTNEG